MKRFSPCLLACVALLGIVVFGCNRGDNGTKPIQAKRGMEMVLIPAGEFLMGDANGEDDEKPVHRVHVGSFYMDTTEVTQDSFQTLMGQNPAKSVGPDKPVERVSWLAAVQYCNMRSTKEGLKPCYDLKAAPPQCDFTANGYRLPTEAEWEYACRAGTTTPWSFGDNSADLAKYGWYKANSEKTTHPVKQKPANPWGLYDMYGNVAEWCNDFYSDAYDPQVEAKGPQVEANDPHVEAKGPQASKDPRGPASGTERVMRGGSFAAADDVCRSSARQGQTPVFADTCFGSESFGFRCVRGAP